ncbi:MAG: L-fuconolactonase [Acidobacteriaceae bacterium]|nr:L-fuconolactonase [Acidobacteriaceae bacterium]
MDSGFIDAHHHLWRYVPPGQSWMSDGMEVLRRDFLVDDLRAAITGVGITGTIVVEAERSIEETLWLCKIAANDDLIRGIVGWAPLTHPEIASELEQLAQLPKLRGIRHPIHDEPDDQFLLREDFNRGIAALKQFDLRYDILIFEKHLPQTIQFVDRHPDQIFIVDHIAKPCIRDRALTPWKENLRELARRPNVYCKLSGMATEADWSAWTYESLSPYIDVVLETFGPRRLMFGSDWPVVTLASSYGRWWETVRIALSQMSPSEQEWILSRTAIEAYELTS